MAIYRFRVCFEDHEDIYRDIDLRAEQNFHEFAKSILESIGFDQIHGFTWFKSDDFWRKGKELATGFGSAAATNTGPFSEVILRKIITDPHQKFLFVYDQNEGWTFLVELVKVLKEEGGKTYPLLSKQGGIAPKQYKIVLPPGGHVEDEDEPGRKKASRPAAKKAVAAKAAPPPVVDDDDDDDDLSEEDDHQEEISTVVAMDDADGFDEDELSGLEGSEGEENPEEDDEFGTFDDSSGGYDDNEERY